MAANGTEIETTWLTPLTDYLAANVHPVAQAFLFTFINWITTTLGASAVFLTYKLSIERKKKILECMFGFGGGVMLAAAFWGLLVPANDLSQQAFEGQTKLLAMIPLCGGFILGILFLFIFDLLVHKISEYRDTKMRRRSDSDLEMALHQATFNPDAQQSTENLSINHEDNENSVTLSITQSTSEISHIPILTQDIDHNKNQTFYTRYRRTILLVIAVTLHNIPEGIVVGFAFAAAGANRISLASALTLSIGVGIQNIAEGLAVSLPCQREGMSAFKSFILGSVSGAIEPVGGLIGSSLMLVSEKLLPYALSFAAGCMVFIIITEMIPEITVSNRHIQDNPVAVTHISHEHTSRLGVLFFFSGFVIMMILDVTLA